MWFVTFPARTGSITEDVINRKILIHTYLMDKLRDTHPHISDRNANYASIGHMI